jgi:hypothetical protein
MSVPKIIAVSIFSIALVGCANSRADQNTQRPGDHSTDFAMHGAPEPTGPVPSEMAGNTLPGAPGYGMTIPGLDAQAAGAAPEAKNNVLQARR